MCSECKKKQKRKIISGIYLYWDITKCRFVYIGQAQDLEDRLYKHLNHSQQEKPKQVIEEAIKKYGIDNYYVLKILCPISELNYWEPFFVKELKTRNYYDGYNFTDAPTSRGYHHKEETKNKLSNIRNGKYCKEKHPRAKNPEQEKQLILDKHSNAILGKYFYKENKNGKNKSYCEILDCGCGHSFDLEMNGFKIKNSWCRECFYENNKGENSPSAKNPKQEKQLILDKHPNCIIEDYFYKNHGLCFNITCGNGHNFNLRMGDFKNKKSWCRKCANKNRKENNKGENNPAAKVFKLMSPNNEIFIIKGILREFCKKYNLSYVAINNLLWRKTKIKNNHKGWKIEYSTNEEYLNFFPQS